LFLVRIVALMKHTHTKTISSLLPYCHTTICLVLSPSFCVLKIWIVRYVVFLLAHALPASL
jgi:hypothetical protein